MKKIAFVIPYIGKLRNDFSLWLESVKNNQTIDFIIFTDSDIQNPPNNLKIIHTTFLELQKMFQSNFDFKIALNKPYKFCDFRPAYGEIFKVYLNDYEFWGHTDMDMIYGNLRNYLTDTILDSYDRIFGLGHMSLYRNTPDVNAMYRKMVKPNYRQVYSFSEGCAFDEYFGVSRYWDENLRSKFYTGYPFDDIDCMSWSFKVLMHQKELKKHKNIIYAYENGSLYRISEYNGKICRETTMYVHLQKRDMEIKTIKRDQFMIIPNQYIDNIPKLTLNQLRLLTHGKILYLKKFTLLKQRIYNKIRKLFFAEYSPEYGKPPVIDSIKYYKEHC